MKRKGWLIGLLLLALLLTACGKQPEPLFDDFSDPDSGWGAASSHDFTRGYENGRYQIRVDTPGLFVWTTHPPRYRDVSLSVTVIVEGNPDNHYGLICRAGEAGFYYFAVSSDGYYGIFRAQNDGALIPLGGVGMRFTSLLSTGENQLRAECDGTQLSLYINGERVAEPVEDATLKEGEIGFGAGLNLKEGSATFYFDDFEATPLGGER